MLLPKRRTPCAQAEQALHFSHKHFFVQSAALFAHHDLHCPGFSGISGHEAHPLQLFQLHFFDQGLEFVEQNGLHCPGVGVGLDVGARVRVVVGVEDEGVVGEGPGLRYPGSGLGREMAT